MSHVSVKICDVNLICISFSPRELCMFLKMSHIIMSARWTTLGVSRSGPAHNFAKKEVENGCKTISAQTCCATFFVILVSVSSSIRLMSSKERLASLHCMRSASTRLLQATLCGCCCSSPAMQRSGSVIFLAASMVTRGKKVWVVQPDEQP